jgi:hypothetical protein
VWTFFTPCEGGFLAGDRASGRRPGGHPGPDGVYRYDGSQYMKRHSIQILSYGTERIVVDDPACQRSVDDHQLVTWLLAMGPWDVIAHLTWRDRVVSYRDGSDKVLGISEWSAARGVEKFMNGLPGVSYFYSVEKNPSREGHHAHMLWGDCENVWRKEQWARWFKLHGRARIEPVKDDRDVASYASKYVMKLPCWWNVCLRWHRSQNLRGVPFLLERDPQVDRCASLPVSPEFVKPSVCQTDDVHPGRVVCRWSPIGNGIFENQEFCQGEASLTLRAPADGVAVLAVRDAPLERNQPAPVLC